MPASAPAVHSILTALVQQPCVPADVAQAITSAVSQGHADAASAVFASLSGQGISPQLACLGNGFGIAWLHAVRCECPQICHVRTELAVVNRPLRQACPVSTARWECIYALRKGL